MGVAIEGGKIFLAGAESGSEPKDLLSRIPDGTMRLEPNVGLDQAHQLVDLSHRVEQQLRTLNVSSVALVATRKHAGLTHAEALRRIVAVCALMAACVQCRVAFRELKTSSIAKYLDADAASLQMLEPTRFGFDAAPMYWKAGMAKAFAAAALLLEEVRQ